MRPSTPVTSSKFSLLAHTLLTGLYSFAAFWLLFGTLSFFRAFVLCCSADLTKVQSFRYKTAVRVWGRQLPRWRSPRSQRRRAMAEARPQWWTMRRKLCWCKRKWSAWRGSRPPAPTLRTGSKCSTKCSSSCPRWERAVDQEHSWFCGIFVSLLVFGFVAWESAVAVLLHLLQLVCSTCRCVNCS